MRSARLLSGLGEEARALLLGLALLPGSGQTDTRAAGVFAQGLNWASPVPGAPPDKGQDDGSWVGQNTNSLAEPGEEKTYLLYAPEEGPFLLYSTGDDFDFESAQNGGFGDGGQLAQGLFGAVMVEPELAEYYRSQVNREDLCLASTDGQWDGTGCERSNPAQLPRIDYQAVYPAGHPRAGRTILNMVQDGELVHSDLTAIIAGPSDRYGQPGMFPAAAADQPVFHDVPQTPNRREPYREFTIIYHESFNVVQAFSSLYGQVKSIGSAADNFGINYGMGGIASEILANRLGVGPMQNCSECKYEEFFLSAWAVGDPAMNVDKPAEPVHGVAPTTEPALRRRATRAHYPDDPSNVYHSYISDHTSSACSTAARTSTTSTTSTPTSGCIRPTSPNGDYTDSQAIGPGSAFTMEMVYNGSGNVNQTVGDAIFHCHFYPHFARGMWSMWRVHDVFEEGTKLDATPAVRPTQKTARPRAAGRRDHDRHADPGGGAGAHDPHGAHAGAGPAG